MLRFRFFNCRTIRSRAKYDRQKDTDTKATIISVVGEKQICKQFAQKDSSPVDGWLNSVICWPTVPAQKLVGRVSHFFTCIDCLTASENHTL